MDELLPAYAAGELAQPEREQVEAALAESPSLREELARYQTLFLLLAAAASEDLQAPGDIQAQVARRLAIKAYLELASELVEGLLGAYGRAIVYYLRLA
jgi:anti-sigma factor RsiW